MKPASLSVRLVAAALIWLALILAGGGFTLAWAFRDTVEREFSNRLDAMLRGLVASVEIGADGKLTIIRPQGDPRFGQVYSGWYWQVQGPRGEMLRSRSLWDEIIATRDNGTQLLTRSETGPRGERLLIVERDLELPNLTGPVHVLIAGDLREVAEPVHRFGLLLAVALGLLGAGLAAAILIQVRFGLRPLRAMAADLEAVRSGTRARLETGYPAEVAPLAESMNAVLDKDAELIERARTHVGNLAHGLKTPLAVMAADPDPEVARQQVQAMRRLIEHHLGRASAMAGAGRMLGTSIPIDDTAQGIAAVLSKVFADRNLSIQILADPDATFAGHREDLEEILGNLMENACKWARTRIRVSAHRKDGALILAIEDDGPGMAADKVAEASRRGRRLDEMSEGWGLGLSIVADLVAVNGGDLTFGHSELGGLAVNVRFT